ncbi:MAG: hypothetical protein RR618_01190 [Cellulosilyticaceae bacterium]
MKKYKLPLVFLAILLSIYLLFGYLISQNMFFLFEGDKIDLIPILNKSILSDSDYATIFEQTGLAKPLVEELRQESDFEETLLHFQENYLTEQRVERTNMNALTRVDKSFDENDKWIPSFDLAPYKNGYIFLSKSTYTFNWRHGHAGIVVDAKRGKVLESLEPGTESMLQDASKWQSYPTFKMMRLKDTPDETLEQIAYYAYQHLSDIPYNIVALKNQGDSIKSTQCSLLVWQAFKAFGIDIDSNKGIFVSPQDIAKSPYLETLQIFGFDPSKDW